MSQKKSTNSGVIPVIGAAGYVGRNVCSVLNKNGYDVVALSRRDPKIEGVEWREFDSLETDSYEKFSLEGLTVVNCAAATEDGVGGKDEFDVNHKSVHLIENYVKGGKLIHMSSSSIYNMRDTIARPDSSTFVSEDEYSFYKTHALNNYSHTKSIAEHMLSTREWSEMRTISLRPHGIYGRDDTTLMPRVIERVKWVKRNKSGFLVLPNAGKSLHTLTHIDNLTEAVMLAVEYDSQEKFEAFNVNDGIAVKLSYAIRKYLELDFPELEKIRFLGPDSGTLRSIAKKFPNMVSEYQIAQLGYDRLYSIDKAKRVLGYRPEPFKVI